MDAQGASRRGAFVVLGDLSVVQAKPTIPLGVLFSNSGPYANLGREGLGGALTAIAEINNSDRFAFEFSPQVRDPKGSIEAYAPLCREIVSDTGAHFVVGCTTSWSRKEVIPVLEKTGAQLWYPCPYEGFESNDHVVYVGACPNQHAVPLLDHIVPAFGASVALVGSNYIWGWETNRIAREHVEAVGGSVLSERYVALGDTDIAYIVEEIARKKPDFVFNTLIGPSSHAFVRAYAELGRVDRAFSPATRPIVSCNWTEHEIDELGEDAAGHFSVAPYFQSMTGAANARFLAAARDYAGASRVSAFFAQSYSAVYMIAHGVAATKSWNTDAVLAHAQSHDFEAPFGPVRIDGRNNHAVLAPHIGRANANGQFEPAGPQAVPVLPDPYLASRPFVQSVFVDAHAEQTGRTAAQHLKVVK